MGKNTLFSEPIVVLLPSIASFLDLSLTRTRTYPQQHRLLSLSNEGCCMPSSRPRDSPFGRRTVKRHHHHRNCPEKGKNKLLLLLQQLAAVDSTSHQNRSCNNVFRHSVCMLPTLFNFYFPKCGNRQAAIWGGKSIFKLWEGFHQHFQLRMTLSSKFGF